MVRVAICLAVVLVVVATAVNGPALGGSPHAVPCRPGARPVVGPSVHVVPNRPLLARSPAHRGGSFARCDYGVAVPAYQWGYFGAHSHDTLTSGFRGYFEDYHQFSWQRGY